MSKTQWLVSATRKTCGMMLVLSALVGTAYAGALPPDPVPEIDPSSVLGAFALLSGGLMILTDRHRARVKAR
jgi:hypothetical protein